jgi:S-adenosylmethionine-diacylgycerolhomoserine-N-methlytransferase
MIRAVEEKNTLSASTAIPKKMTRLQALQQALVYLKRSDLVHQLPIAREAAIRVLEVGCSEGYTLEQFANHFVNAQLVGLDPAKHWLERSQKTLAPYTHRIDLVEGAYTPESFTAKGSFDVLLFSYQLSKSYVPWREQLEQAYNDLKPGGLIVVLDFHTIFTKIIAKQFQKKQRIAQPQLLELLETRFAPVSVDVYKAYFGLWKYFSFVGIKPYGPPQSN